MDIRKMITNGVNIVKFMLIARDIAMIFFSSQEVSFNSFLRAIKLKFQILWWWEVRDNCVLF